MIFKAIQKSSKPPLPPEAWWAGLVPPPPPCQRVGLQHRLPAGHGDLAQSLRREADPTEYWVGRALAELWSDTAAPVGWRGGRAGLKEMSCWGLNLLGACPSFFSLVSPFAKATPPLRLSHPCTLSAHGVSGFTGLRLERSFVSGFIKPLVLCTSDFSNICWSFGLETLEFMLKWVNTFLGCWDGVNAIYMCKGHEFWGSQKQNAMDWIVSLQNPYVKALTQRAYIWIRSLEVIKFKWSHKDEALIPYYCPPYTLSAMWELTERVAVCKPGREQCWSAWSPFSVLHSGEKIKSCCLSYPSRWHLVVSEG